MKQHNIFSKFKFNLWEAYYVTIARHINLVNQLISLIIRCFILSFQAVYNHHFFIWYLFTGRRPSSQTDRTNNNGRRTVDKRSSDRPTGRHAG